MADTTSRTPFALSHSISACLRSRRWLRPPQPGRSRAQSLRGRAHQIRFGSRIAPGRAPPPRSSPPLDFPAMCRVFGCVAAEPASIRHELLEAENPMIRQSEDHDSGWGMAVYERADGTQPTLVRCPEAAHADGDYRK